MQTPDWNEELCRKYAEGLRPLVRYDHAPWAKRIADHLRLSPPNLAILDIATGPGFLLLETAALLPPSRLVAQDAAAPMLAFAKAEAKRRGLEIETICCPAEQLDLPGDSLDVVLCKQLLHEAADVDKVLREMARVLKPGGKAFVIDFDANGSRLAAFSVRTLLTLTRGYSLGRDFWRSFRSGLPGPQVRQRLLRAGFQTADYQRSGFNYLVVGTKRA